MEGDNHGSIVKSMDRKMKSYITSRRSLKACRSVDLLTGLPDEVVSKIVSMLPTIEDVAATQVLCKKMRSLAFTSLTSVDLDASSLCHRPDHFPLFVSFVDHVFNHLSQPLTRFRLHVGGNKIPQFRHGNSNHYCTTLCFPVFEPSRLNTWISYPLAHRCLRELDLTFNVGNPSECRLPHQLFACHFLEVLKLNSNLNLGGDEISLISLPNLKQLHLYSFLIVRDDFLTKLVSGCPSLEDLECAYCEWIHSDRLAIHSQSLRRLLLIIIKHGNDDDRNSDLVVIDAPNLQYFKYQDNLAIRYSITNMNALVQATIKVTFPLRFDSAQLSNRIQLSLVRLFSNVQHLSLLDYFLESMHFGGEPQDPLPMFHNLKTLELGWNSCLARWDKMLLEFLACSPNLETLAFPEGFLHPVELDDIREQVADLEDEGYESSEATPLCLQSSLKRIVIKHCYGAAKELNLIKFLLQKALILDELEIIDFVSHELASTLIEFPRASITCSIRATARPVITQ